MYKVLTLNNISVAGLEKLPRDKYEIASEVTHPDAILLRSFKMPFDLLFLCVIECGRGSLMDLRNTS